MDGLINEKMKGWEGCQIDKIGQIICRKMICRIDLAEMTLMIAWKDGWMHTEWMDNCMG